MKQIHFILFTLSLLVIGCQEKIDYVDPTWARAIYPEDGATVQIDFFDPEGMQVFAWEARPEATYTISFDVNMHFEYPYTFEMGATDSLKITNEELLATLREVWPDFASIQRFFWQVEQTRKGEVATTWRYFNAILAVENFVDERDGEKYEARQFVLNDGSLMTIMAENLRATVYADGSEFPLEAKVAETGNAMFDARVGNYYSWATAVGISWEEAKAATLAGEPVQGVCPDGWHLPSLDEYNKLREYLGTDAGGNRVKDPSYWRTTGTITNDTKMNIMASGFYWHEGVPYLSEDINEGANPLAGFWSASPCLKDMLFAWGEKALDDDPNRAVMLGLYDDVEGIYVQAYSIVPGVENRMYPVRCVMDQIK